MTSQKSELILFLPIVSFWPITQRTVEHRNFFDWSNNLWSVHAERIPETRFSGTIHTRDIAANSESGWTSFVSAPFLGDNLQWFFGRKKEVDSQKSGELDTY